MTTKLAARYTTAISTMEDRLNDRREAGATGLEYAGMIAVAALVVYLVYTAIDAGGVGDSIKTAITDLFKADSKG